MSRVLLSYFASVYCRFITGMPIQDATAGFKCYRRSTLEAIDFSKIQFVGYAFQIEMKFTAWRKGIEVVEVLSSSPTVRKVRARCQAASLKRPFLALLN